MSLFGSAGLPGSVYSSTLPLPLVSRTNGAQPCALTASPVSSHSLVLTQPATGPVPEPKRIIGVVAELRMMGAEAGIDEAVLLGLGIENRNLPSGAFQREGLGRRMV